MSRINKRLPKTARVKVVSERIIPDEKPEDDWLPSSAWTKVQAVELGGESTKPRQLTASSCKKLVKDFVALSRNELATDLEWIEALDDQQLRLLPFATEIDLGYVKGLVRVVSEVVAVHGIRNRTKQLGPDPANAVLQMLALETSVEQAGNWVVAVADEGGVRRTDKGGEYMPLKNVKQIDEALGRRTAAIVDKLCSDSGVSVRAEYRAGKIGLVIDSDSFGGALIVGLMETLGDKPVVYEPRCKQCDLTPPVPPFRGFCSMTCHDLWFLPESVYKRRRPQERSTGKPVGRPRKPTTDSNPGIRPSEKTFGPAKEAR